MVKKLEKCRICGSSGGLLPVLGLGTQELTGVFPKSADQVVTGGPLDLTWCSTCSLLQLGHSFSLDEMYGDNYGYRSGLNASMVEHLTRKVQFLERLVPLNEKDLVVDIGSNDATTLKAYSGRHRKVGIDPTGKKFAEFYTQDIALIPDFFSAEAFQRLFPNDKAKIVTSISMFYDLERPADFVHDIESILADDGVWHFEQSYMPAMLRTHSYDTVCHEHLEFYSFGVVKRLLEANGLRVVDVQMNAINGGSFAVTACKRNASRRANTPVIDWLLREEDMLALDTPRPFRLFEERVFLHRKSLAGLVNALVADGKKVFGYGASTKGNVLLQFCGFTPEQIPCIADVNEQKFGCVTPGTHIPIISEAEAHAQNPDYFLVLPWHFRNTILAREKAYLERGGKFIFPLPEIEIV